MEEVIRFALLGFGVGSLYALCSLGLIVIYRGSGVLNFALGAIGIAGAYFWYELHVTHDWPFAAALVAGVAFSMAIGVSTHLLLMRPLRRASPMVRVIATLGLMVTLQAIAVLRYQATPRFVTSALPTDIWHIHGTILISADRIILLGIATAFTALLWWLYRYTRFGLGTTAVAENQRAAASLGWSPDTIAALNWALGCGLAGLAAILIAPIVTLQPTVMTNLVLAATAAALVAGFRSFPVALLVGIAMGIAQTEVDRYVSTLDLPGWGFNTPGWGRSVPFLVIVGWMVFRGQALPLRDYLLQRLPTIGTGRFNWPGIAFGVVLTTILMIVTPPIWIDAFTVTLCVALVLLSVVVLTGYTGQLSLAQFALAGFGAWVAGRLIATQGVPFWLGLILGLVATVPLGMAFALPAVRTRGINLAILTLGLGTAIELILFNNSDYTGGIAGTQVGASKLFGLDISAAAHPGRYGIFALGCLVIATLAVGNVRRGRVGRRMIAVRTNERAAAALGISVPGVKLYAFGLSAAIAALGGILLAFRSTSITYPEFTTLNSITFVGLAVVGGVGFLFGPVAGASLATGGLWGQIFDSISTGTGKYIVLIGGASVMVLVLLNQNGLVKEWIAQGAFLRSKLAQVFPFLSPSREPKAIPLPAETMTPKVPQRILEIRDLTVKYDGTVALERFSATLKPGRVLGLIGPNGAGKTTLIDAVTGFKQAVEGSLLLDGEDVARLSPSRRARAGIGRSFQSLELFDDSTVLANLRSASDPHDSLSYLSDLVYPREPPLTSETVSVIKEFRLQEDLDRIVETLPYGQRRLLAIARAVVSRPSILLLDEPAAGLDEVETRELTSPGTILGTAGYLSPEQARGEPAGPASDRYGLGVVAFELLTGSRPFPADTPTAEAFAHANTPPPSASSVNPKLPRELDDVLARALAKQPEHRFETCAEFVVALRDAFRRSEAPTVVAAAGAEPATAMTTPRRRVSLLAPLAAAAVLLGLAGVGLALALAGGDGGRGVVTRVQVQTVQGEVQTVTQSVTQTVTAPAAPEDAAPPADGRSGEQLNNDGFALMRQGDYGAALPLLEQAVAKLQGSGDLAEAYASYNLAFTRLALGRCDGVLELLDRSQQVQGERKEIDRLRRQADRRCGEGDG